MDYLEVGLTEDTATIEQPAEVTWLVRLYLLSTADMMAYPLLLSNSHACIIHQLRAIMYGMAQYEAPYKHGVC